MKVITYSLEELGYTAIDLGKQGENLVKTIQIDLKSWLEEYPGASIAVWVMQPGTGVYLAATKVVDGVLNWEINDEYTTVTGFGALEIVLTGANGEILKSAETSVFVAESMSGGVPSEAPEAMKPYLQQIAEYAADVERMHEEIKNISSGSGNMPTGGTTGQILAKKSNESYDAHWIDPPKSGGGEGTVTSVTVNGTKHEPDSTGNVNLGTIQGGGGAIADSIAWDKVTGKPSTYPPSSHTHSEYLAVNATAADSTKLGGVAASGYLKTTGTAADSSKLGGVAASGYLRTTGTAANSSLLGGKPPEAYYAVNLLDNSDWRNPVNQRGQTVYNVAGYHIDRWYSEYSRPVVTVNNGYVTLENSSDTYKYTYWQKLPAGTIKPGTKYSCAMKTVEGDLYRTYITARANETAYGRSADSWKFEFGVRNNSSGGEDGFAIYMYSATTLNIEWLALYEGEYSDASLPAYVPKGFASELLACQRYLLVCPAYGSYILPFANGYTNSATQARVVMDIPMPLLISTPSIKSDGITFRVHSGSAAHNVSAVSVLQAVGNKLYLSVTSEGLTEGQGCALSFSGSDKKLIISAESQI